MFPPSNRSIGSYRLIRRIGGGGMGEVYLAEDSRMGVTRQVAIKTIRAEIDPYPDQTATKEAERLFRREMQAITKLDHPYILPLYDFGEEQVEDTTTLTYMVMPFRPEGSLANWLQKQGATEPLRLEETAHFVGQAAQALQHAHTHGLIHQDVKPANFLIRERSDQSLPDILLADFGIVKISSATMTASQSIRGTPAYMAPEQWNGQPLPATDQYALAIMAYLLLTRQYPFKGNMQQVMRQHLEASPSPPSILNPLIPSDLDTVILHALQKSPAARFASIAAFANAFQQAIQPTRQSPSQKLPSFSDGRRDTPPVLKPPPNSTYSTSPEPKSFPDTGSVRPIQPTGFPSQAPSVRQITPDHNTPVPPASPVASSSTIGNTPRPVYPPNTRAPMGTTSTPPVLPKQPTFSGFGIASWFSSRTGKIVISTALILFVLIASIGTATRLHNQPANPQSSGSVWTVQNSGVQQDLLGVTWSGAQFVAVGVGGTILTAHNGSTWTVQNSGVQQDLWGVAWSGSQFAVVGVGGTILTSHDGSTWTAQRSSISETLRKVAWSDSQFVAVGDNGTILTSHDGSTWTTQHSAISDALRGIAWSGSQFVVVGDFGTILASPDGITWTYQNPSTPQALWGIAWSGSQFVAVGTSGTILTSHDGITWTPQSSSTQQNLWEVVWSGTQFVAVEAGGAILTSPDGITWMAQSSHISQDLWGVAWSGSQFVAVGASGTILTSP